MRELVDHHEIGEVQHFDLFELTRSTVLTRHDVEGDVRQLRYRVVALSDARRLDKDQIKPAILYDVEDLGQSLRNLPTGAARRDGSHERTGVLQAVEANPIAEQRAAGLPFGWVHRDDRDPFVVKVMQEPTNELVRQAALACAAGTGQTNDGNCRLLISWRMPVAAQQFRSRDLPGEKQIRSVGGNRAVEEIEVTTADHFVDHALKAKAAAVLR